MNKIDKTIKDLEYAKYLLGLPEQGSTWSANSSTIAIDKAIQTLEEKKQREQGCEYCNVENKFSETGLPIISKPYLTISIAKQGLSNKYFLITNEYTELKNIKEQYDNSPSRGDKCKINYCLKCGRELNNV